MALAGVANHVLSPNAGRGMGYLAIAVQFGFAFAFPVGALLDQPCVKSGWIQVMHADLERHCLHWRIGSCHAFIHSLLGHLVHPASGRYRC